MKRNRIHRFGRTLVAVYNCCSGSVTEKFSSKFSADAEILPGYDGDTKKQKKSIFFISVAFLPNAVMMKKQNPNPPDVTS